jgi:hypothetical protein
MTTAKQDGDLVAELRGWLEADGMSDDGRRKLWLMRNAADEITLLRSRVERLEGALTEIRDLEPEAEPVGDDNTDDTDVAFADGSHFGRWQAANIAREALSTARGGE